ncbi:MAG: hypothetical protein D6713_06675 [Deltaproteobacteria bacterium]|nr:MAG: hypothetical protein D6713_06675 [Deltaproteobacteria bacterium]
MEKAQAEKGKELLEAVRESIAETGTIMDEILKNILEAADKLRFTQDRETFEGVGELVTNLQHLFEYVSSLKEGVALLGKYGYELDDKVFERWDEAAGHLEEIASAFERKDWVYAADVMEYELHPLLSEGVKGLKAAAESMREL